MSGILLDKVKIERQAATDRENPYRVREVIWQLPEDCIGSHFFEARRTRIVDWLEIEEGRGWTIASKETRQIGPFQAQTEYGVVIPGQVEWRLRAVFKYTGPTPEYTQVGLPSKLFKDHWLKEAGHEPDLMNDKDVEALQDIIED